MQSPLFWLVRLRMYGPGVRVRYRRVDESRLGGGFGGRSVVNLISPSCPKIFLRAIFYVVVEDDPLS
jgi:hypothetical protein